MDTTPNYNIEVSYDLYVNDETGQPMLVEKTSEDHPFKFINGLGFALEAFEANILTTAEGESFSFVIPVEDAYGEFQKEHVLELKKDIFTINGKFDDSRIYPGSVVPMTNEDGNHFNGIVKEIKDNVVIMDFNHPLAGKALTFKGKVLSKREATQEEIQKFLNHGEDCHCGDCNKDCGEGKEHSCCGHCGDCKD